MRKDRQSGLTLISFFIVLVVLGFFALIGMKLFPIYSEYYGVVRSMKTVQGTPGVQKMTPDRIWDLFSRSLYINYSENVKRQHFSLTRKDGYKMRVSYEVRKPLIFNLDVVAKFDRTVDLRSGG